jgi:hypothetical protein
MDWFDDVVLVATAGPKFTKAEIVENEVTRYVSEPHTEPRNYPAAPL